MMSSLVELQMSKVRSLSARRLPLLCGNNGFSAGHERNGSGAPPILPSLNRGCTMPAMNDGLMNFAIEMPPSLT